MNQTMLAVLYVCRQQLRTERFIIYSLSMCNFMLINFENQILTQPTTANIYSHPWADSQYDSPFKNINNSAYFSLGTQAKL